MQTSDFEQLLEELKKESLSQQTYFKHFTNNKLAKVETAKVEFLTFKNEIEKLKTERKERSGALQKRLFDEYKFLNGNREEQSLLDIFGSKPPAGAGECAVPKLLHYAFSHQLKPIAMAEFWWGQSPKSEIRKHKEFYPACRSKCEPILGFMLQGIDVEPNPMLENTFSDKKIDTVFEDEFLIIVNKPEEFLSVPGKNITDSVQTRIKQKYPNATLVHRLDQSTSGILLIAKEDWVYHHLQRQFTSRSVKKRYVALLDGILAQKSDTIDLPLRVDLDNRPHQMVCYQYGKPSQTYFEVIEIQGDRTKIHFYPITGRTHQLRVHASHPSGLNMPIVGDDLYGKKSDRLYLHAEYLQFKHPKTGEEMKFEVKAGF
jgi:tRNA pseudouridine32 synthase/23S rRNA pseudouridine746 synthase